MRTSRALVAADARLFGRAQPRIARTSNDQRRWDVLDDARLFGSTFLAGFLFVSILIA